jgi:hypothetical protein
MRHSGRHPACLPAGPWAPIADWVVLADPEGNVFCVVNTARE